MIKVALTGGIGCGKTTVCHLFSQLNIPVIDTDIIARELVAPGTKCLFEIVHIFGDEILSTNGELNRSALAKKIFNHTQNKLKLESILHPKITAEVEYQLSKLSSSYVIIAIPLLIETHQQKSYDQVLVIDCSEEQQIQRTLERDQRDLKEIKYIIQSQVSREKRLNIADDVINNSKKMIDLNAQVFQLHNKYLGLNSTTMD